MIFDLKISHFSILILFKMIYNEIKKNKILNITNNTF